MAELIEDNLGIYREDPTTGQRTLLETQRPLGTYTVLTTTGLLDGSFLILPSNSAPRIKAVAASPLVFSPERPELDRPKTEVFVSIATALSPKVFITVDVTTDKGEFIRRIAENVPLALAYDQNGEEAPLVAPEGCDPRIKDDADAGAQKTYHYQTAGAPKVAEWDGKDQNQNFVASGVYKFRIRVADGVGNVTTDFLTMNPPKTIARIASPGSIMLAKREKR